MAVFDERATSLSPMPDSSFVREAAPTGFQTGSAVIRGATETADTLLKSDALVQTQAFREQSQDLSRQEWDTIQGFQDAVNSFKFPGVENLQDRDAVLNTMREFDKLKNSMAVSGTEFAMRRSALLKSAIDQRPHLQSAFSRINSLYDGTAAARTRASLGSSKTIEQQEFEGFLDRARANDMEPWEYAEYVVERRGLDSLKSKLDRMTTERNLGGFVSDSEVNAALFDVMNSSLFLDTETDLRRARQEYKTNPSWFRSERLPEIIELETAQANALRIETARHIREVMQGQSEESISAAVDRANKMLDDQLALRKTMYDALEKGDDYLLDNFFKQMNQENLRDKYYNMQTTLAFLNDTFDVGEGGTLQTSEINRMYHVIHQSNQKTLQSLLDQANAMMLTREDSVLIGNASIGLTDKNVYTGLVRSTIQDFLRMYNLGEGALDSEDVMDEYQKMIYTRFIGIQLKEISTGQQTRQTGPMGTQHRKTLFNRYDNSMQSNAEKGLTADDPIPGSGMPGSQVGQYSPSSLEQMFKDPVIYKGVVSDPEAMKDIQSRLNQVKEELQRYMLDGTLDIQNVALEQVQIPGSKRTVLNMVHDRTNETLLTEAGLGPRLLPTVIPSANAIRRWNTYALFVGYFDDLEDFLPEVEVTEEQVGTDELQP